MEEPTYYAVVFRPQVDGSWTAELADFPEVKVDGAGIDEVKQRITIAGKKHLALLGKEGASRCAVGYVHLRDGGNHPWTVKPAATLPESSD